MKYPATTLREDCPGTFAVTGASVCPEDWKLNDEALKVGNRLLSAYTAVNGVKFWIITEWDRSTTTILLPEDY